VKRKICVVTGSRADYGHLRPLIQAIKEDKQLILQILATGMHVSADFGLTYREIEKDGFKINHKLNILLKDDTPTDISSSMSVAVRKFAAIYKKLNPDVVVVLGDRFEIISAVLPAYIARIPVAHLHGGEVTEGAVDDALRHAITKMSLWHFASTKEYRKRIIQLGEEPKRVFNCGAVGLDNLRSLKLLSQKQIELRFGFKFKKKNFLITFHPVTLENNTAKMQFKNLLSVLRDQKDTLLIFTKSNADTGGRSINALIDQFVKKNSENAVAFTSMGQLRYFSTLQYVDGVIGNSSSGIIEVSSFKKGTINIGDRQKGRIIPKSVIHCTPTKKNIRKAINKLCSLSFKKVLKTVKNPYGDGKTAQRIIAVLKSKNLPDVKKKFFDIKF